MSTSINWSSDNRTVTLQASLPEASVVTVTATNDVLDLSDNTLADFTSSFTTAQFDTGRPSVINQRPGNGARDVAVNNGVVIYTNESLETASVNGAFFVSQNGDIVNGNTAVTGNGRTIQFIPDILFAKDALVQVFLTTDVRDTAGNLLHNYQASFRTETDTGITDPLIERTSPVHGARDVPIGVVIDAEFNEPVDPLTVNGTNVMLFQNVSGTPLVAATISLIRDGRVVRIDPDEALQPNTPYFFDLTSDILDLDGAGLRFLRRFSFTTGAIDDNIVPNVLFVTPPDGAIDVGVNAGTRVRFDEPVNPLSVNETTIMVTDGSSSSVPCTISFSNLNQDVLITPHAPFTDETLFEITVEGVEDISGNLVAMQTTQFTSGVGPDTIRPQVIRTNPFRSAVDVPINAAISIEADEAIDLGTVNSNSFIVSDNTTGQVAGSYSLSAGGRVINFVPDASLALGRRHSISFSNRGMLDLAGNLLTGSNFSFTTSSLEDNTGPQVVGVSPEDALDNVPVNTRIVVQFDEPVQSIGLEQVTLSSNGGGIEVIRSLSNANRTLTLKPLSPLDALTVYTVTIGAVKDIGGNALASLVVTTFTTETGADLVRPTFIFADPLNSATDVPTNAFGQIRFSERVNKLTLTDTIFFLERTSGGVLRVPGSVVFTEEGSNAIYVPDELLAPSTAYRMRLFSGVTDLAGNVLSSTSVPTSFTTESGEDNIVPTVDVVSPSDGTLGVTVNARVVLRMDERVNASTVSGNNVIVSSAGIAVSTSISIDSIRKTITVTPDELFAVNTLYTVSVSGITDHAGNLATPFNSSFTTGDSNIADVDRPLVVSINPVSGATGVDVNASITLTFDDIIDPTTVSSSSVPVRISGVSGVVSGSYSVVGTQVIFVPDTVLPVSSTVSVTVNTNQVMDIAGNGTNSFQSSFVTTP